MESIISAVITGVLAFLGILITNMTANKSIENKLITAQAVTDTKIDMLTEEVKKHNNFASRVPVMEEQIKVINHRISDLEESEKTKPKK